MAGVLFRIWCPALWLCSLAAAFAITVAEIRKKNRIFRGPVLFLMLCLSLCSVNAADCLSVKTVAGENAGEAEETDAATVEGTVTKIVQGEKASRLYLQKQHVILWLDNDEAKGIFPGDRIQASGTLAEFEKASDFGQFDSYSYYKANGIAGQMWPDRFWTIPARTFLGKCSGALFRFRCAAKERLFAEAGESAGILSAILLGDKSGVTKEITDLFQDGGAAHLLSVSGLHVQILCMGLYRILRKMHLPVPLVLLVSGVFCAAYVVMTGESVSALRAGIMFGVWLFAIICGRTYDMISAAGLAALLLLIPHPYYLMQSGFLLSFGAVFFLFLGGKKGKLAHGLILYLGMAPILAEFFGKVTLLSTFVNLIILPLVPVLFVSGLLGVAASFLPFLPCGPFLTAAGFLLRIFEWVCGIIRKIPFGVLVTGHPALWQILLYGLIFFMALLIYDAPPKWFSEKWSHLALSGERIFRVILVLAAVLLPLLLHRLPERGLSVTMLDVGQGECILIHLPDGSTILSDGGSSDVSDVFSYRLEPALTYLGVTKLDAVLISHGDYDHCSAVMEMFESGFPVDTLYLPAGASGDNIDRLLLLSAENGTSVRSLSAGDFVQKGEEKNGTAFSLLVLSPEKSEGPVMAQKEEDANDRSIVFRLSYGSFSMLFTGDISAEVEEKLVEEGKIEHATVLKVPHHGSKYSSCEVFLDAVSPELALISCGRNSRYHHPAPETIERLEETGCEIFTTPKSGQIRIFQKKGAWKIRTAFP